MSYLELDNVVFRGVVAGATGEFNLDIDANVANVVDSLHIQNGAVTIQYASSVRGRYVTRGHAVVSMNVVVPDNYSAVEVIAYCSNGASAYFNGWGLPSRSLSSTYHATLPLRELYLVNAGTYHATLIAANTGHADAYMICRYIRETGG